MLDRNDRWEVVEKVKFLLVPIVVIPILLNDALNGEEWMIFLQM